jgi:hypothetical protein
MFNTLLFELVICVFVASTVNLPKPCCPGLLTCTEKYVNVTLTVNNGVSKFNTVILELVICVFLT